MMNLLLRQLAGTTPGQSSATRIVLVILLAALVISALISIGIIVINEFGETQLKILGSFAALAFLSLVSLPSLVQFERGRYKLLSSSTILASLVHLILLLALIWGIETLGRGNYNKTLGTLAILVFSSNHIFLMLMATSTADAVRVCLRLTNLVIFTVAVIGTWVIWTETESGTLGRVIGVLLILDVLGSFGVPAVAIISKNPRS